MLLQCYSEALVECMQPVALSLTALKVLGSHGRFHPFFSQVEELRAWAATQPALNAKERQCVLEKVTPGLYFDIVCQVAALTSPHYTSM